MNIINILYSKEYWFSVRSEYACKITHISFVIHFFVRSNNFNNNNIKSQIIRFRVLRSGDPQHSISGYKYYKHWWKYIGLCAMAETSEALKTAKMQRRSAKASLTRLGKALNILRENQRPADEVRDYLLKVTQAFSNVVLKHESYANLIEDDELLIQEELCLEQCQSEFLKLEIDAKQYIESVSKNLGKINLDQTSKVPQELSECKIQTILVIRTLP